MAMQGTLGRQADGFDWQRLLASRWLWCLAAVLFLGGRELLQSYSDLVNSLGDTDDATRLYQVRQLMATGAWFDMSLPRIGGDTPLISHWSRLIDLPLMVLLKAFGLVMSPAAAEMATRITWPLVLTLVFLRVLTRAADAEGGQTAAAFVIFFALTCLAGLFQFRIGRIDHHNGMILGSVGGLLLLVGARRRPDVGTLAGVLIGLGLGVGYEPLAFLLPALGAAALMAIIDIAWLAGITRMAVAMTATLALVFVATVAPTEWLSPRCDALSLNMVLLAAGGTAGLVAVDRLGRGWALPMRIAVLAAGGVLGLAGYGVLDTRCLAGPFAQVNPAINPIWLDHVVETHSVFRFFAMNPVVVVAFALSIAVGIAAAIERWHRKRTPEALALMGLMLIIAPTGAWMVKLMPYASWVAAFCAALTVADLTATAQLTALSRQMMAALVGNQMTLAMLATPLLSFGGVANATLNGDLQVDSTKCMTTPAIRSLATLPKGRFVGSIDFGAYIVALTPHDVLAAPYHRVDKAIILNQKLLAAEPAEARTLIDAAHADYVVLCMPHEKPQGAGSGLEVRLKSGEAISYLTPVAINSPVPELRVWRVVRE